MQDIALGGTSTSNSSGTPITAQQGITPRVLDLIPENQFWPDPNLGMSPERQFTADFGVFAANYETSLRIVCYRAGLFDDECDEMMQRLWLYFLENRLLEKYDWKRGTPFQTYVFGYTHRLIQRFKYTLGRVHNHELSTSSLAMDEGTVNNEDSPADDGEGTGMYIRKDLLYDEMDVEAQQYMSAVEVNILLAKTLKALKAYPATSTKDFGRLFADLCVQVVLDGEINQQALADRYKALLGRSFSRQAVQQHVRQLVTTPPMLELREALRAS